MAAVAVAVVGFHLEEVVGTVVSLIEEMIDFRIGLAILEVEATSRSGEGRVETVCLSSIL